ncbi:MAG: hypothetical protein U1E14_11595 [Geminicoccaceae bacterium]
MVRTVIAVSGLLAMAAAPAWATGPTAVARVNERVVLDGCEVGSGGNDIQSIQSHYEPKLDRIVVTLRLCARASQQATYRVHLDHAAPFVGKRGSSTGCVATVDTVVEHTPTGHRGVGTSSISGKEVRFTVPLGPLQVGSPKQVPLIALWGSSVLGDNRDRAPNNETGDRCSHPQATTETLVQSRIAVTGIAFVSSYTFTGQIAPEARTAIALADATCQQQASQAGIPGAANVHAWLTNSTSNPASFITDPGFGPIQTADGTVVAASIAGFAACDPIAGNQCLGAPISQDVHGNFATNTNNMIWTATVPAGTNPGGEQSDCNGWTSNDPNALGDGGSSVSTNAGFTLGVEDNCNASHPVYCIQFE